MQYFTNGLYAWPRSLFLRKSISVSSPILGFYIFVKFLYIAGLVLLFSGDVLDANDITLPTRIASSVPELSEFSFPESISSLAAKLNYDQSAFAITTFNSDSVLKRSKSNHWYKFGFTKTLIT